MAGFVGWIKDFIRELRRRRVIRVAVVYAGTAFVILQLGEILVDPFDLPGWTLRMVTFLLVLGFPLAIGLAWVYNITEEGLVHTDAEGQRGEIEPGGKPFTSNVVIIGLLVVAIGLLFYSGRTGPPQQLGSSKDGPAPAEDTAAVNLDPQSVAVLPFTYLAAEDSADYLSIGMTDEIIGRLSQIEDLSVRGRTSVMRYQDTDKPIPQISRELNVAHVVEGSVTKAGGQIRVQIQLLDGRSDEHLWSEGYTRPFEDVLQLQVDLAREVAGQLEATLVPETERRLASAAPVDSAAYALYLQARKLRFQETGESLSQSVRILRRSLSIDSTFAPAWATLSTAAWLTPRSGGKLSGSISADSLARVAAQRALELDSTSAEAHVAIGIVHTSVHNYPVAGQHFRRAVEMNPGLANAHREYGLFFRRMGRFEMEAHYLKKAARLDPASPVVFRDLGINNLYRGNYEQAKRHLEKALKLGRVLGTLEGLWAAYSAQDSAKVARRKFSQEIEANPEDWRSAKLLGYSADGRSDSARQMAVRLSKSTDNLFYKAVAAAHTGQLDKAMRLLHKIGHFKSAQYHSVKINPLLKPLWDEPSFQRELEKIGLDEASIQQTMEELSPAPPDAPSREAQDGSSP